MKFSEFNLSERLQDILVSMNYKTATQIQEESIPLIMEGRDILASSQTGTGKTGAFLIPFISMVEQHKNKGVLVTTPTRELAKQVYTVANQMMGTSNRKSICSLLIGGEDINRQIRQLRKRPKIIIGTPGRINDHLTRKTLNLKHTHYLVLDETDRMLDMGFGIQIDKILKFLPEQRQTVLFSATLPKSIIKLSGKYLKNPARIAIGNTNSIVDKIKQNIIHTERKFEVLIEEIEKTLGSILVFVRTQRNAEDIKARLVNRNYITDALHGGLRQNRRVRIMSAFRGKRCNILVATDVASRGLDISHIEHVINYDMPDNPEDYIHRVGRTARAGKEGIATSLVSKADKYKLHAVERFLEGDEEGMNKQKSRSLSGKSSFSKKRKSSQHQTWRKRKQKKF
ncbi:DEAD/DEAH box helicase [Pseudomonadota bacterium]